tara:strand:+ start:27 stop:179 length:153 start_codon:yes stop_codon:yes gene_type:complete
MNDQNVCIPLLYIRLAYPLVMSDSEAFEYDEFCAVYWAEYGWDSAIDSFR